MGAEGRADTFHQNKGDLAAADLLVLAHVTEKRFGCPVDARNGRHGGWEADSLKMRADALTFLRLHQVEFYRQIRRHDHADRNGFPMVEMRPVAAFGFQRMAEGMPKVEQRPDAAFPFILGDNAGLGPDALFDGMDARGRI